MENVGQAVIDKVNIEAQNIIDNAKEKANLEIENANRELQLKLDKTKKRKLQEAEEESARIISRASIEVRQNLVTVKAKVVSIIIDRVKTKLAQTSMNKKAFISLVTEAADAIKVNKARIYVPRGDVEKIKEYIKTEIDLSNLIIEFLEGDFVGGFILEDTDGKLRIDNTYATRMEMLLPRMMPEINRELFQS